MSPILQNRNLLGQPTNFPYMLMAGRRRFQKLRNLRNSLKIYVTFAKNCNLICSQIIIVLNIAGNTSATFFKIPNWPVILEKQQNDTNFCKNFMCSCEVVVSFLKFTDIVASQNAHLVLQ